MTTNRLSGTRRRTGPIEDTRTISRRSQPFSSLYSRQLDSVAPPAPAAPLRLAQVSTPTDYDRRESARVFGEQYADVQRMINNSQLQAGDGVTIADGTISVDTSALTSVGTLTSLDVSGTATIGGHVLGSVQYATPAAGDTVTGTSDALILNPAATLATLTIVFPATPSDGQRFSISSSQNVTALTATATFANANGPPTAITAGTPLGYIYNTDATAWFAA